MVMTLARAVDDAPRRPALGFTRPTPTYPRTSRWITHTLPPPIMWQRPVRAFSTCRVRRGVELRGVLPLDRGAGAEPRADLRPADGRGGAAGAALRGPPRGQRAGGRGRSGYLPDRDPAFGLLLAQRVQRTVLPVL